MRSALLSLRAGGLAHRLLASPLAGFAVTGHFPRNDEIGGKDFCALRFSGFRERDQNVPFTPTVQSCA